MGVTKRLIEKNGFGGAISAGAERRHGLGPARPRQLKISVWTRGSHDDLERRPRSACLPATLRQVPTPVLSGGTAMGKDF